MYAPDYTDAILLLEVPEGMSAPNAPFPPAFVRSALADLRNAGVLAKIRGMVVGRPFAYEGGVEGSMWREFEKVVVDSCYGFSFPILGNVDTGHSDPVLTLPLGAMVSLDSEKDAFVIEERVVR